MVPLEADAAPEASRLLTRAFFDDPLNVWLFPDERHRASVLPIVFEAVVRGSAGWGAAWTTSGEILGAASWMPPGILEMTAEESVETGFDAALGAMGAEGTAKAGLAFPFLGALRARDMPEDHWYLGLLGVEPNQQGTGIGSRLIAVGLALADQAKTPAYLETIKERNVEFYKAHGFRVMDSGDLPGGGPRYWTLRRDARG